MHRYSSFDNAADRAYYRPEGQASAGELADLITSALEYFYDHDYREVVVNIRRVHGFDSPGPAYRRWLVRRWARATMREIAIVVVAQEEHICSKRSGLIVAAEEGLRAHICTAEDEANAVLDAAHALHH